MSPSTTYSVGCLQCDYRPTVSPDSVCEIKAALNGKDNLIPLLADLGIVTNHHMRLLIKWGSSSFFNTIPLHILDPLHRTILAKYLFQGKELHQSEGHPMPIPIFQQPSPDLERQLIHSPASALQNAMGLDHDIQSFEHVVVCLFASSKSILLIESRIQ
jgi:hypothetical protein